MKTLPLAPGNRTSRSLFVWLSGIAAAMLLSISGGVIHADGDDYELMLEQEAAVAAEAAAWELAKGPAEPRQAIVALVTDEEDPSPGHFVTYAGVITDEFDLLNAQPAPRHAIVAVITDEVDPSPGRYVTYAGIINDEFELLNAAPAYRQAIVRLIMDEEDPCSQGGLSPKPWV